MKKNPVEEIIKSTLENQCRIDLSAYSEICKKEQLSFGVAVSGGADSTCLLISLCNVLKPFHIPVKVISVNHFIRPDEETCGDAEFVRQLCSNLSAEGFDVSFYLKELKRGQVNKCADERRMGIEEAARFLRYEAFEEFMKTENIAFLCLAHNKNDFYETVLMRFLQGASCDSFSGITFVRGKYLRPLLNVERKQIEAYLVQKGRSWRTDSTNSDTNYLRNRIRGKLIPFLSENFEGWQSAVEKGAEKAEMDSDFIADFVDKIPVFMECQKGTEEAFQIAKQEGKINQDIKEICDSESYYIEAKEFFLQDRAIQIRLLMKMADMLSDSCRIPYSFLKEVCKSFEAISKAENGIDKHEILCEKKFADIVFFWKEGKVYVKKSQSFITEYCFSDIISKTGEYEYDWGQLKVLPDENNQQLFVLKLKYKSGKTDKIKTVLPYQLIVNHK